ncbi:MAG: DUF2231 domain-containing protein [Terrimesophilobacter sp.]
MIDYQWGDLPLHVLLVHLVVVIVPAAALCLLLSAFWPAARIRLGIVSMFVALVALIAVPATVTAGDWLYLRVESTPLIERHAALGPILLPWVIAMFGVTSVVWLWYFLAPRVPRTARIVAIVVLDVAAVVTAIGSVVAVVLVGESGAAAVWTGKFG